MGSVHTDFVAVAERLPVAGETMPGMRFSTHPGGKGGNQAVAAARAGGRAMMLGRVGADAFGASLRGALAAAGVDVSWLRDDPEEPTGASAVLSADGGDYCSVIVPAASTRLSVDDIGEARSAFDAAAVVIAQLEIPLEPTHAALISGKQVGCVTILNAAPAPKRYAAIPTDMWAAVDVLVANRVEVGMLLGQESAGLTDIELAGAVRVRCGIGLAVVTLGSRGVAAATLDDRWFEPGHAVTVSDAVGAGDAFVGTFAVALGHGLGLRTAVRRANAAGAISVTRVGGYGSSPTAGDVDAFLAQLPLP